MGHGRVSAALAEQVFARDQKIVSDVMADYGYTTEWTGDRLIARAYIIRGAAMVVCPAVVIDWRQLVQCSGRWTIDHVLDTMGNKMGMVIRGLTRGKRAPGDLNHLISLCEGHTERGMKGGSQWNTAHRPEIRDYLEKAV